jgi:shikimate kinase
MGNIILTGIMGSGKTSVGKEISRLKNFIFFDTDEEIEKRENLKISDIFEKFGEKYFRDIENKLIRELLNHDNLVISLGGGIFCNQENIKILKKLGKTIFLKTSVENILNRLSVKEIEKRPLLKNIDNLNKLLKDRDYYYNQSDLTIITDNKSIKEIVDEIFSI